MSSSRPDGRTLAGPEAPRRTWHNLSPREVASDLVSDLTTGLDDAEAARRLASAGPNAIVEGRRRGAARILLAQFSDFLVIVLLAAAVVAVFIGEPLDTIAIIAIVVLNALLGFIQEFRAERAVQALKAMAAPQARVRRGGVVRVIPAADLVPGDVVLLEAGQIVPADLRIVEAARFRADESALTGESEPVDKTAEAIPEPELPLPDRRSMAYKGTIATYGRAVGVVVATGMGTELGRIAAMLSEAQEERTPLQRRLAGLGRRLALGVLLICAAVFGLGLVRGEDPLRMLLTSLSLAVAAIPEALPAVVTVSLALGARRMAERNALIRRLPAVETLGSVTFICSDKTGTLTENRMRLSTIRTPDALDRDAPPPGAGAAPSPLLTALALSNDAERGPKGSIQGDPTEAALLLGAAEAGCEKSELARAMPRLAEIPFEASRGRMTTLHPRGEGVVAFTKGAPERVLPRCKRALMAGGESDLDGECARAAAAEMASNGLRVLAVASRDLAEAPEEPSPEEIENDLTLLGLVGLVDPVRRRAREAVEECRSAGIRVVMITGDHPSTAAAVSRSVGILKDDGGRVVAGAELDRLSGDALRDTVEAARVYARAAPEQKILIVRSLQERGQFVAMTGDGVNDAPALRRADIGVAMGRSGTDVAREAAHMVLLDDNFATIVAAVREGRRIYDNIRKFVRYALTCNSAEIWTLLFAPLLGLPIPLLPIQILWINLVTDGLPGLALTVEPEERGVMRRPPRPPAESLLARGLWQHVLWVGLLMGGVSLFTQAWAYRTGSPRWQSMTFTVLALLQLGHALAIRSEYDSVFRRGLLTNKLLLGAVVLSFGLQLAILYVPVLNRLFRTVPLTAKELFFCIAASTAGFLAAEADKLLIRRGWLYRKAPA